MSTSTPSSIWTIPNLLSLLRAPLALLFLSQHVGIRSFALALAMLTDILDGYLARRIPQISSVGTMLDPLMDKFFVYFAVSIFWAEGTLQLWEISALAARDFAVLLFGLYLGIKGRWSAFRFQSIWCGKISTALQLLVLLGATLGWPSPPYIFMILALLGGLALVELAWIERQIVGESSR